MKVTQKYRDQHPVEPISRLTIRRQNGDLLRISASGTARLLPSIDLTLEGIHPSGRAKTDYINIQPEELKQVIRYLQNIYTHWT